MALSQVEDRTRHFSWIMERLTWTERAVKHVTSRQRQHSSFPSTHGTILEQHPIRLSQHRYRDMSPSSISFRWQYEKQHGKRSPLHHHPGSSQHVVHRSTSPTHRVSSRHHPTLQRCGKQKIVLRQRIRFDVVVALAVVDGGVVRTFVFKVCVGVGTAPSASRVVAAALLLPSASASAASATRLSRHLFVLPTTDKRQQTTTRQRQTEEKLWSKKCQEILGIKIDICRLQALDDVVRVHCVVCRVGIRLS